MYSFPNLEPVCCSMSGSNCCFLTCIQISQEAVQVVWYSISWRVFHSLLWSRVKGFVIVNKAEVDVFLELLAFLMIQRMLALWSLVPLPFLNPAWTSGSSWFMYCWSLAWRILSIILLACELSAIVQKFEHSLALPFFGIGMKTDLFQSCGHCWVFQISCHIECSTFTASSFFIWNSSTGIPSPPLALLVVMLPKAHLASHSRMSGSRWVTKSLWLCGPWRSFSYRSSVYCCHLFLISSASVRSIPFLSFIVLIFAWNVPLVSLIFLKRSLVFPLLLFSSIYLHWSLRKAFLSLLAILWNSGFKWVYLSFSPLPFTSFHSYL